jgi:hypothetical protein
MRLLDRPNAMQRQLGKQEFMSKQAYLPRRTDSMAKGESS